MLRARVTRDKQQPVLIRQRVNRALGVLRLKQLLELPPEADLRLADALGDEKLPPAPVFAERVSAVENALRSNEAADLTHPGGLALPARVAVDQTRATVRTREASLKLIEAQRMPSVSLELELRPHRLSRERRGADLQSSELDRRRQHERAAC